MPEPVLSFGCKIKFRVRTLALNPIDLARCFNGWTVVPVAAAVALFRRKDL